MWNLKVRSRVSVPIAVPNVLAEANPVVRLCTSLDGCHVYSARNSSLYCLNRSGETITHKTRSDFVHICSSESEGLLAVCQNGDMVTYDANHLQLSTSNPIRDHFQSKGLEMDINVVCSAASPQRDISCLVVESSENKRLLFICFWNSVLEQDPVEIGLCSERCSVQNVSVGWGHRSTQFHGSMGKEAAKAKSTGPEPDWSDRSVSAKWRLDGEYFAINALDGGGIRRLFVYDRNGALYSRSDEVELKLSSVMCWKSNGEHIACVSADSSLVVFFEKNGLEHGKRLRIGGGGCASDMSYNVCGSVLAVCVGASVLLYERSNYTWFLKNKLVLVVGEGRLSVAFDAHRALVQHCVLAAGSGGLVYDRCEFEKVYSTSESRRIHAVVDGGRVDLTPFGQMVVPPPMCAASLDGIGECVTEIAWVAAAQHPQLFVLTAGRKAFLCRESDQPGELLSAHFAEKSGFAYPAGTTQQSVQLDCEFVENVFNFSLTQTSPSLVEAVSACCRFPGAVVHHRFDKQSKSVQSTTFHLSASALVLEQQQQRPDRRVSITDLALEPSSRTLIVLVDEMDVLTADLNSLRDSSPTRALCHLQRPANRVRSRLVKDRLLFFAYSEQTREMSVYDDRGRLSHSFPSTLSYLLNDRDYFILVTKSAHEHCSSVRFVSLHELCFESDLSESFRSIETGAELVMTLPDRHSAAEEEEEEGNRIHLLVQMPRGNIELITPRFLIINEIIRLLNRHSFMQAFELALCHRIDPNVLCDYDLQDFLENCSTFVEQLQTPKNLNTFLSCLSAENVLVRGGTYSSIAYLNTGPGNSSADDNKVSAICDRIQQAFKTIRIDERRYLSCLIYCEILCASSSDEALAKALIRLRGYTTAATEPGADHPDSETVDDAFKVFFQKADEAGAKSDDVFNIALGTYDLGLAMLVVHKTGLDPKKYLGLLNGFKAHGASSPSYMKYVIDCHLHHYENALDHLLETERMAEQHDQIVELVRRHGLFPQCLAALNRSRLGSELGAVWVLSDDDTRETQCFKLIQHVSKLYLCFLNSSGSVTGGGGGLIEKTPYADHLENKQKSTAGSPLPYSDRLMSAGLVVLRAGLIDEAIEYLSRSSHKHADKWTDALVPPGANPTLAGMLSQCGGNYQEMRRIFADEALKRRFVLDLDERVGRLEVSLDELAGKVPAVAARVEEVRRLQFEKLKASMDGETFSVFLNDDDASSSSCGGSTISTDSTRSSASSSCKKEKQRKKLRRRMTELKTGSRYEDIALVTVQLWDHVKEFNMAVEETRRLSELLLVFTFNDDRIVRLDATLNAIRREVQSAVDEGWMMTISEDDSADQSFDLLTKQKMRLAFFTNLAFIDNSRRFPPLVDQVSSIISA